MLMEVTEACVHVVLVLQSEELLNQLLHDEEIATTVASWTPVCGYYQLPLRPRVY